MSDAPHEKQERELAQPEAERNVEDEEDPVQDELDIPSEVARRKLVDFLDTKVLKGTFSFKIFKHHLVRMKLDNIHWSNVMRFANRHLEGYSSISKKYKVTVQLAGDQALEFMEINVVEEEDEKDYEIDGEIDDEMISEDSEDSEDDDEEEPSDVEVNPIPEKSRHLFMSFLDRKLDEGRFPFTIAGTELDHPHITLSESSMRRTHTTHTHNLDGERSV